MSKKHFTIVILAYNCEQWVEKCLGSAINQDYSNYDIVFVDDASTDATGTIAGDLMKDWDSEKGTIEITHNSKNVKALENLYNSVQQSKPETVIVALDGDDWLLNSQVLQHMNKVYENEDVWITAGSYIESVGGRVVRPRVTMGYWNGNIRHKEWTFSHLRTFKRELFLNIKKQDMIDRDGDFFKFTWDRVIMYPMVEMAGQEHFKPINKIQYVYNRENPLAVDVVHRQDQLRIESVLRNKNQYEQLEEL